MAHNSVSLNGVVKSMGLVFGDIGTSPIYALTAIFFIIPPTPENVIGMLSLILWTLTMLVTVQYTYLAMHLGTKGEGGTIVLKEILLPMLKSRQPDRLCLPSRHCRYRPLHRRWCHHPGHQHALRGRGYRPHPGF